MKKFILLFFMLALYGYAFAVPSNTLSITPVAVDATTITASDENTRNNTITSIYNAHSHSDIVQLGNYVNLGDGLAGNKIIYAYNADDNKPYLKFNDTDNNWTFSTDGVAASVILQQSGISFEGATNNSYKTNLSVTDPTAERTQTIQNDSGVIPLGTSGNTIKFTTSGATAITLPTSGVALPSGAVFYMMTGSCPSGTTDVTATYSNKFIKINATQGTSSGTVLTGTSDSHTLTTTEMPAHDHNFRYLYPSGGSTTAAQLTTSGAAVTSEATTSAGSGGGHTHTLSAATTLEPSSITCKMCQVD